MFYELNRRGAEIAEQSFTAKTAKPAKENKSFTAKRAKDAEGTLIRKKLQGREDNAKRGFGQRSNKTDAQLP